MVFVKCFSLGLMVSGDVFPFSWAINKDQNSGSRSGEILLPLRGKKTPLKGSKNFVLIDVTKIYQKFCGFRIITQLFSKNFMRYSFSATVKILTDTSQKPILYILIYKNFS